MADPHPVIGIDLNVTGSENDPEEDGQVLGQPVVQVFISNPIDWDQVQEDFFFLIWATPYFFINLKKVVPLLQVMSLFCSFFGR